MGSLVVVALPDENDRVWKVSSEKVPHLTLLYLGEDASAVPNVDQIIAFVQHAANTMLRRFYLPVDRRGELGADQADVLFFKKNRYDAKAIREFRSALLQDDNIKTAYDSTTQFDGPWQPHLTLGYPTAPAKELADNEISSFYDVNFNRIAVWTGDSEGPEFLLRDYWDEVDDMLDAVPMDVSMSDIEHHGVKGMKWGQTKSEQITTANGKTKMVTPKKAAKADQAWEKRIYTVPGAVAVHNASADHFNARIGTINDKPEYQHLDLYKRPDEPAAKQYTDEINRLSIESTRNAVEKVHGKSPTGKTRAYLTEDGKSIRVEKVPDEAKHADDSHSNVITVLRVTRDAQGLITKVEPLMNEVPNDTEMTQTVELGAEFLAHYGVKGMRWGVRRAEPGAPVAATATSVVPRGRFRKTAVKTEGGENQPAHEDAIKVARAQAKLKKSGTAALSNQELQELQTRLNLERNVTQLVNSTTRVGKGRAFVRSFTNANQEFNNTVNTGLQTQRLGAQVKKPATA